MKHLKRFNEGLGNKGYSKLHDFLLALDNELKPEGFRIEVCLSFGNNTRYIDEIENFEEEYFDKQDAYINITGGPGDGTYFDFVMDTFSIGELRDKCNEYLDDDKKSWPNSVSDHIKDMYDRLCTAILVFLDKEGYTKLVDTDNPQLKEWRDVISILDVDDYLSRRGKNDKIRRLMAKYNINRK